MKGVECGVRRLAVDHWDYGIFEALDELMGRGGRHGVGGEREGGGRQINNRQL